MGRTIKGIVIAALLTVVPDIGSANEYTDVIDAFDMEVNDPFDLNLSLGYERIQRSSLIKRETLNSEFAKPEDGEYYAFVKMFDYAQVTHILNIALDVGLYKDLSIRFSVPLILNDTRELDAHKKMRWEDLDGNGTPDEPTDELFPTKFKSPQRSGLDHLSLGLWWGILDQGRDETKPNWVFFLEGRFAVGDTLKAACDTAGSDKCSDLDYNTKGGISRGVHEINVGTRLSRRYGIADPYFGFDALVGFPKSGTPYDISGNSGQINTLPPVVGSLDFGIEFIPWEMVESNRKFSIGLGGGAKYHSEGREYTPLFDALGLSPYLKSTESLDPSIPGRDQALAASKWSGMTDVENYATLYGKIFFMIQPAKYIKFHLGSALSHETEHFITKTDLCTAENLDSAGECSSPNWGYRQALDDSGNRFVAAKTLLWDFFVDATAMF